MSGSVTYRDGEAGGEGGGLWLSPAIEPWALPEERYSRKVFVGGLPPDIDEEEIKSCFSRYNVVLIILLIL